MKIICDHNFRQMVEKLPNFEMDLGRAYTKKDEVKNILNENIQDEFVIHFLREYKSTIYKCGVIGPISLYSYHSLPLNQIWIFDTNETVENRIVENYDQALISIDFKKYFASLIWNVKQKSEPESD